MTVIGESALLFPEFHDSHEILDFDDKHCKKCTSHCSDLSSRFIACNHIVHVLTAVKENGCSLVHTFT